MGTNSIIQVQSKATEGRFTAETAVSLEYVCDERDLDCPRFAGQRLVRRLVVLPLSFSRSRPATGSRASSGA